MLPKVSSKAHCSKTQWNNIRLESKSMTMGFCSIFNSLTIDARC